MWEEMETSWFSEANFYQGFRRAEDAVMGHATDTVCYLSDQTGEHKDAREKVSHLKGNLKDGVGLVKTPDVDQTADSVVVTTQVPVDRVGVLEGVITNCTRCHWPDEDTRVCVRFEGFSSSKNSLIPLMSLLPTLA